MEGVKDVKGVKGFEDVDVVEGVKDVKGVEGAKDVKVHRLMDLMAMVWDKLQHG